MTAKSAFCGACGAPLRPDAKFCTACRKPAQPIKTEPADVKKADTPMASASAGAGKAQQVLGTADRITSLASALSGKPSFDVVVGEMLPSLTVTAGQVVLGGAQGAQERTSEPQAMPPPADLHAPSVEPQPPPPPSEIPASPARPTRAVHCSQCGQPMTAGKKFCGACGAPLTQMSSVSTTPVCLKCRSPLALDAQYCSHCGSPAGGDV
jgi:predicted amidophosphoribosyltransferase